MSFTPTPLHQRIESLDMIRGFSLLGILLVNMFTFYTPLPYIDLATWFETTGDIEMHKWLDIFVQASFYPLFSMLFGYGLAMQFTKATNAGVNFYKIGSKRLTVLLLFGVLHAVLIWWGDILMTYAVCGFFLLFMLRLRPIWLVVIGFSAYSLINGGMLIISGLASMFDTDPTSMYVDIQGIESSINAYSKGSWLDAFQQRLMDLQVAASPWMFIMALFTILPYMLLGAAASKWRLLERAKDKKTIWMIVTVAALVIGITLKASKYMFDRSLFFDYLHTYFGGPILAIGYGGLIVLLCQYPLFLKVFRPVSKAGRMSMTTYLSQSVIASVIFYHFGFDLYGKVDVATATLIAVGIFVLQVVFAELWLMKFKQGPIEMIWKRLTYGKTV